MDIQMILKVLLWCTIINYAILIIWFAALLFAGNFLFRLYSRWFELTRVQVNLMMYGAMALYKMGVLLLNAVPLIALWIVSRSSLAMYGR